MFHTESAGPSDWVCRWLRDHPTGHRCLDLACGNGRHALWLAGRGWQVCAVDQDSSSLGAIASSDASITCVHADLEAAPWPLPGRSFDAVVVTNYLWRPLWPHILSSLAPDGLLIYETFSREQARIGRPRNPDFLLEPGELLQRCQSLRILAYEDLRLGNPDRFVQRIAARRERADDLPRHAN